MLHISLSNCALWIYFISSIDLVTCYPTGTTEIVLEPDSNVEKQYNNGTVVGTYTYKDDEGNPVQVKYYADDSNYGVELKSFKVLSSTGKPITLPFFKDLKPYKSTLDLQKPETKTLSDLDKSLSKRISDSLDNAISNRYKAEKSNSDFETYYQNDAVEPNKCGKEKVRVYYDKERRIRNVLNNYEADKFCEQF